MLRAIRPESVENDTNALTAQAAEAPTIQSCFWARLTPRDAHNLAPLTVTVTSGVGLGRVPRPALGLGGVPPQSLLLLLTPVPTRRIVSR